jgi:hypothetical protein
MKISPLDLRLLQVLSFGRSKSLAYLPKTDFWAKVKALMHGDIVLDLEGKEILVKNQAKLKVGEKVFLRPRMQGNQLELEILERSWDGGKAFSGKPLSKFAGSPEELLNSYTARESVNLPENLFSLLKSFFPVLDWQEDTQMYRWAWEDGEAEGFLGKKGEEKVFFLRVQRALSGKMEFVFAWKDERAERLAIEARFWDGDTYSLATHRQQDLQTSLEKLGITLDSLLFRKLSVGIAREGWQA